MLQVLLAELQFPVASSFDALATVVLVLLPVIEVAYQIDVGGVGSPLAEHPSARLFVQSEIEVSGGKVTECLLSVTRQLIQFPQGMVVPALDGSGKGFEPRVVLHKSYGFVTVGLCRLGCFFRLGSDALGRRLGVFFCRLFHNNSVFDVQAFTLKMAFLMAGAMEMQGACPSCGKKMANIPGWQVT